MPRQTLKQLNLVISNQASKIDQLGGEVACLTAKNKGAEAELMAERSNAAHLRDQLIAAHETIAEHKGYLARVREDDTVREDLIQVGEPDGESQLVPKRKPAKLGREYCHYRQEMAWSSAADGSIVDRPSTSQHCAMRRTVKY